MITKCRKQLIISENRSLGRFFFIKPLKNDKIEGKK